MTTRGRPARPTTTTTTTTSTTQAATSAGGPPPDGSLPDARSRAARPVPPGARRRTPPAARVWRSPKVVVGTLGAAVAGFLVLADAGYDYDAVCVDATQTRVADAQCGNASGGGGGGAHWYYLRSGSAAPRVGQLASGGTPVAPDSSSWSVHRGGVPAEGGTVSRGGFGGRLGTVGG